METRVHIFPIMEMSSDIQRVMPLVGLSKARFYLFIFSVMVGSMQACHRPSRKQQLLVTLTLLVIHLLM